MMPGIMTQEYPVPSISDKMKNKSELDGYSYHILKAEADDPVAMSELQLILTRSINGTGDVVLMDKDKFTFMDRYFIVLTYLEKNPE